MSLHLLDLKTAGRKLMPLLWMEWFYRPVISIIILDRICDEFHWPSMGIVSGNDGIITLSAMKRFSLYEGLRRQQSSHYFINLPNMSRRRMLNLMRQDRWAGAGLCCLGFSSHLFFSWCWSSILSIPQKPSFKQRLLSTVSTVFKDRDIHVSHFKSFTK